MPLSGLAPADAQMPKPTVGADQEGLGPVTRTVIGTLE
jgi:hypothetical protein